MNQRQMLALLSGRRIPEGRVGPEFWETQRGAKFYEGDVPRIAKALERIATGLEKLIAMEEETSKEMEERLNQIVKGEHDTPTETTT